MITPLLLLPLASLTLSQKTIYSFGSSYTATGFDPNGAQPSDSNPLGNPAYGQPGTKDQPGTYGGGPNYIDHLVETYNTSLVYSYNYAIGGSVVNNDLCHGFGPDLQHQVPESYSKHPLADPGKTLVTIFMGDNDVQNNYRTTVQVDKLMDDYFSAIDDLYAHNARRFLLFALPPLDRAPTHNITHDTPAQNLQLKTVIRNYNNALKSRAEQYKMLHMDDGVKIAIYDFNAYLNQILDDPTGHGFKDATCEGSGPWSDCVWWSGGAGHVTSRVHDFVAADMSGTTEALGW